MNIEIKVVTDKLEFDKLLSTKKVNPKYKAFYSSYTKSFTQDPTQMRVFIGDEIVTNGHGLFEGAQIRDGYMVHLEQHLDRLFKGMESIKVSNFPLTRKQVQEILTKTVALSGCRDGSYRYFLSAGVQGKNPQLYVIVEDGIPVKPLEGTKDFTVVSPFEKHDLLKMKTTNNIEQCVISKVFQEKNKCDFGIIYSQVEDDLYLSTHNDCILIQAFQEDNGGLKFKFEGGIKRIYDDKQLLFDELVSQGIAVEDDAEILLNRTGAIGLYRLQNRIYEIIEIDRNPVNTSKEALKKLVDCWDKVIEKDSIAL